MNKIYPFQKIKIFLQMFSCNCYIIYDSMQNTSFMANWVLRRIFLKYVNNFFYIIPNYLPLKGKRGPSF